MIDLTAAFRQVLAERKIPYSEKGNRLEMRCVFHDDRTPSSGVYKSTGKFYCFTCDLTLNAAQFKAKLDGEGEVKARLKLEETHGPLEKVQDESRKLRSIKEKVRLNLALSALKVQGISRLNYGKASESADRIVWFYEGEVITEEQFDSFLKMWYNERWEEFYVESADSAIDEARRGQPSEGLPDSSGAAGAHSTGGVTEGSSDLPRDGAKAVRRAVEEEPASGPDGVCEEFDAGDDIVDLA